MSSSTLSPDQNRTSDGKLGSDIVDALISPGVSSDVQVMLLVSSVILAIGYLLYTLLISHQSKKVVQGTGRRPFTFLTIITGLLGLGYVALSIATWHARKYLSHTNTANILSFIFQFFYYTDIALLPAVCLYYLHLRANAYRASQGLGFNSLMNEQWKKIFDCGLVGSLYLLHMMYFDLNVRRVHGYNSGKLDEETAESLQHRAARIYGIIVVLKLTTYVDVMFSTAMLVVQAERQNIIDPVVKHLLAKTSQQFLLLFGMSLAPAGIWFLSFISSSTSISDGWVLVEILGYGFCRLFIGAAITYTAELGTIDRVKERD
ncbi:hypothetical protein CPB86DRAFT_815159 [Serendipita vermifera]|nr:hypothetical protein CPB86DRAFT_815159 [Serendipita vermifera]